MIHAEAKKLVKQRFGPAGVVWSDKGRRGPGRFCVGRVFLGMAVQMLGSGSTWEEAFSEASKRHPEAVKKEGN